MNQAPSMLKPALISGVAFGVAGAIPVVNWINCACCALIIGCGFFAAFGVDPDPVAADTTVLSSSAGLQKIDRFAPSNWNHSVWKMSREENFSDQRFCAAF